ncbi:hypothetical protein CW360_04755 [Pseudomonas fluvialis]|jgi:hypothetical protein|uniref:Copper resistance protein D domain-containing protein n=1 Tax=Pseudomonas fluvialis TaxID=1793966 RepID=A0A2I0CSF8_9PSED|nr:hypothetical protein [Pseudomonas pharmacofabricae]PKF72110.1 hypothetical protein CW360_04755 [Pseudomonas pharmacofabricae]
MLFWLIKSVHLLAAIAFFGTLFYQLLIMPAALRGLSDTQRQAAELALAARTRQLLHWVVGLLYGAGFYLAWHYRSLLGAAPEVLAGLLLWLKIGLALSIVVHYGALAWLRRSGQMTARREARLLYAVLAQMVLIVLLAKGLFVFA